MKNLIMTLVLAAFMPVAQAGILKVVSYPVRHPHKDAHAIKKTLYNKSTKKVGHIVKAVIY